MQEERALSLCLERTVGAREGVDEALWQTGYFDAQVYPDLPLSSSWYQLLSRWPLGIPSSDASASRFAAMCMDQGQTEHNFDREKILVRTIAAQCRSKNELQQILSESDRSASQHGFRKSALLLVSGSHPGRSLPIVNKLFADSFWLLQKASLMRERGDLSPSLEFWAVENPINPPSRLLRKAEAGAETVLTQPPFLRQKSELWFDAAMKNGVDKRLDIVVGVPMISSIGNLRFWLGLCGLYGSEEARGLEESFPGLSGDKDRDYESVCAWNAEFISWVRLMGNWHQVLYFSSLFCLARVD